jgi:hypothetical protein
MKTNYSKDNNSDKISESCSETEAQEFGEECEE